MTRNPHDPSPIESYEPPNFPTRAAWNETGGRTASILGRGVALAASVFLLPGCGVLWTVVAPIFVHGGGRAWFGGKTSAEFVHLSEEDAIEVVREELEAAGYQVGTDCPSYLRDRVGFKGMCSDYGPYEAWEGTGFPDRLDACSADQDFGVEVFTQADYQVLVQPGMPCSSAWSEDYLAVTRLVADALRVDVMPGIPEVGIFYDPLSYDITGDTGESGEDAARERAYLRLRLQVRDFVAWLQERHGEP